MSGYYGDLSSHQEAALSEFREAVASLPNKPEDNDYYYLRWLRAKKFNVKKAVAMLKSVSSTHSQSLCGPHTFGNTPNVKVVTDVNCGWRKGCSLH